MYVSMYVEIEQCIDILLYRDARQKYIDTHQGCGNVSTPYVVMFYGAVMSKPRRKIYSEANHTCNGYI